MINLRSQANARAEISRPATFKAPLFRALTKCLETGQHRVILDLGGAHAQTIAFLNRYRCRLDITDLGDGLDKLNAETDPRRLSDVPVGRSPYFRSPQVSNTLPSTSTARASSVEPATVMCTKCGTARACAVCAGFFVRNQSGLAPAPPATT